MFIKNDLYGKAHQCPGARERGHIYLPIAARLFELEINSIYHRIKETPYTHCPYCGLSFEDPEDE